MDGSQGKLDTQPLAEEKEEEVVIHLNHPDLPPDIKLKKRIKKKRADLVSASIDAKVILNENTNRRHK